MPARLEHLHALRQHLNGVLAEAAESEARDRNIGQTIGQTIGLEPDASAALRWLQQSPTSSSDPRERALTLAFSDDCPGSVLPRVLQSPLDGSPVPVRSVRGASAGRLHLNSNWVRVRNVTNMSTPPLAGTLGAILRLTDNPSRLFALTAGHVVGVASTSGAGDAIALGVDNIADGQMIGRLFDWAPNFARLPPSTTIDAAVVNVDAAELEPLRRRPEDWPRGAIEPFAGESLHLRTRDRIFSGGNPQYLSCRMAVDEAQTIAYLVSDALCWTAEPGFEGGDSGAPIWSEDDELVAIHTGTTPEGSVPNAVAIPIGRILKWAGARVVLRGEKLLRKPVPRDGQVLSGTPRPITPPAGAAPTMLPSDVITLAKTMWGEARGEPDPAAGMSAVAQVVFNRVARQTYWGKDVEQVCTKPFQFSCWNARDPNLPQMQAVTTANATYALALQLAQQLKALSASERSSQDRTSGATHYHARRLQPPPRWARGHTPVAQIGNHLFYRDIA